MAITKEKKKEILQDLVEKFSRSKTVVFSDYRGLDVSSISELRNQLRAGGAECKVAKKTLMRLAAKETDIGELSKDIMEGPVSATFSYEDELAGLQILFKFSKGNENLKLLGGIIDGKVVGKDEIMQLAQLPSKEELYAKLLGSMNAPISGFVGVLSNVLGGFVRVLNAYKDTLPAEEAEAPVKEEKIEDKPVEEPAAEEKKMEDKPAEEAPAETEDKPAEPSEETPATDDPADKPEVAPEEEASADEPVEEEAKEEEAPAEDSETVVDSEPVEATETADEPQSNDEEKEA